MKHSDSKRIVIDASVARSSGDKNATFPLSKHCRDFLLAVRENEMFMVFSPEIREEWNRHQSSFALTWRASMVARKKLHIAKSPHDEALRKKIAEATLTTNIFEKLIITTTAKALEVMDKDYHLLEAALVTDQNVVSLDEVVRKHFSAICQHVSEIKEIVWVNPGKLEEKPIEWLNDGAENERQRQLRNFLATDEI